MSEKVVLMFLSKSLYPETRAKQKIRSLVKNKFKVYVLAWDREGQFKDLNIRNLVFIKHVHILTSKEFNKIKYALSAILLQLYEVIYGIFLLRKYGKLIVHANDFNTLLGAYLLKRIFPKNITLIYDSYELTPFVYSDWYSESLGVLMYGIESKLIKYVDYILVPSYPVGVYLKLISGNKPIIYLYNFPSSKLIPHMNKQQARSALNLPKDKTIIAYVGSMRTGIALEEFLKAIRIIKEKGLAERLHFIIIGHGPLKDFVEKFIKENDLGNIVTFKSMISREEIFMYLIASDYSYIILQGDNMRIATPWKLTESLACKVSPIVNEGTYAAKLVKELGVGVIVKNVDPESLAKLFERLSNETNEVSWHNLDPRAFTWESQEKEFIKIHMEVWTCGNKKT